MEESGEKKRSREEEAEEISPEDSPEAKRLRADIQNILDDDEDGSDAGDRDPDPAVQDLASVMKSFEEEIALLPPPPLAMAGGQDPVDLAVPAVDFDGPRQSDLEYLLGASDDELGLPATVPSSSDESADASEVEAAGGGDVGPEPAGFGQIWGFDDEINGYEGLEFGIRPQDRESSAAVPPAAVAASDDDVVFDGGLFDHSDVLRGQSDFGDLSWRPESLPAV